MNDHLPPAMLSDRHADIDSLDFTSYADTIAAIAQNPATDTPLTIGVFGEWGSGKTTLLKMVQERVKNEHIAVWFTAWKYDKEQVLWRALLLRVIAALRKEIESTDFPGDKDKASKDLEDLEEQLYHTVQRVEKGELQFDLRDFLAGATTTGIQVALATIPGIGLMKEVIQALGKEATTAGPKQLVDAFQRAKKEVQIDQIQSLEQFEGGLKALIEEHIKPKRLIVLVDDLDRCLPEKAVGVLEAIKLFMDVEGCIFVMGMEREIITKGIRIRYGKLGEVLDEEHYGERYLEKIIQVPFDLPPIDVEDVNTYVVSLAPGLDPRCREVFSVGIVRPNPRRIKRMINSFLFLSSLADARIERLGKLNDIRLAKVVAIQHAHPDLYNLLSLAPNYLIELENYLQATSERLPEMATDGEKELDGLRQELRPFAASPRLRALLLHCGDDKEACFGALAAGDVASYFRLTRSVAAPDAGSVRPIALQPELVEIPAGPFHMGTSDRDIQWLLENTTWAKEWQEKGYFDDEKPERDVNLPAYQISRYPVTNRQYQAFVQATGRESPSHWDGDSPSEERANHPVVYVSYGDAVAYCQWLSGSTGRTWRLPTEAEWEKAARGAASEWDRVAGGTEARQWPWGNTLPDEKRCNFTMNVGATTPVGHYGSAGASPYGCDDMAGNVWEWTSSIYSPYPYDAADGREDPQSRDPRVLRGGAFYHDEYNVRCACRLWHDPGGRSNHFGFRVGAVPIREAAPRSR